MKIKKRSSQEPILSIFNLLNFQFFALFISTFVQYICLYILKSQVLPQVLMRPLISWLQRLPASPTPTFPFHSHYDGHILLILIFFCSSHYLLLQLWKRKIFVLAPPHPRHTPTYTSHLQSSNVLKGFKACYPKTWHIKYFQLKEIEKQQVQEGLSHLTLKQVIRCSCEKCPPYTQRKRTSLSQKMTQRGIWTNRPC